MRRLLPALVVLCAACEDGPDPFAPPGSLRIAVSTSGRDLDGAYQVRAGGLVREVTSTAPVTVFSELRPGSQTVTLEDVAPNCTVVGGAARPVTVTSGVVTDVAITVSCTSLTGAISARAIVTGALIDSLLSFQVGSGAPQWVGFGGSVFVGGLAAGSHTVTLGGVAENCTVAGANPRTVPVTIGSTVRDSTLVEFSVGCIQPAGAVRVFTRTTGGNIDPDGYFIMIDGGRLGLDANSEGTVGGINAGSRSLRLEGLAANCSVNGANPVTVTIPMNGRVDVTFDVVCVDVTEVSVTVQTTGVDFDRNGYRVRIGSGSSAVERAVAANGTTTVAGPARGTYPATLLDVAPNCEVTGDRSPSVTTTTGSGSVAFAVTCGTLASIAWANSSYDAGDVFTGQADGTGERRLTTHSAYDADFDGDPAWSSTGRIAFRSYRDGVGGEIYVMNADGSGQTRLTFNDRYDGNPSWSPDGSRIAFESYRDGNLEIYVMNADGSNVVRLTSNTIVDRDAAWSPDGTRIAFVRADCEALGCASGVWVMAPDGQNALRLTTTGSDWHPTWSPDGGRIAFSRLRSCTAVPDRCIRDIVVMSASGGAVTTAYAGSDDASEPAWSPNGARFLISSSSCGAYGCSPQGVALIRADGSGDLIRIVEYGWGAVWRP